MLSDEEKREIDLDQLDAAWPYWRNYDAYPKRIAFQNGKLLAFCAQSRNDLSYELIWWDNQNRKTEEIPASGAIDDQEFMEKYIEEQSKKLKMAKDEDTNPEILIELAKSGGSLIKIALSENPSLPAEAFRVLTRENSWKIQKNLSKNPSLPSSLMKTLLKSRSYEVRMVVARRKDLPLSIVADVLSGEDLDTKIILAGSPNLSNEAMSMIIGRGDENTRIALAKNRHISIEILKKLMRDKSEKVVDATVENPKMTTRIFLGRENSLIFILNDLVDRLSKKLRSKKPLSVRSSSRRLLARRLRKIALDLSRLD